MLWCHEVFFNRSQATPCLEMKYVDLNNYKRFLTDCGTKTKTETHREKEGPSLENWQRVRTVIEQVGRYMRTGWSYY